MSMIAAAGPSVARSPNGDFAADDDAGGDLVSGGSRVGDCVLPQGRQHQAGTPRRPSPDMDKAFADAWFKQNRRGPRRAGRRRQGRRSSSSSTGSARPCKAAHFAYKPMLEEFEKTQSRRGQAGDQGLPAEQPSATYGVSTEMHPAACEEAAAVRLAREKGKEQELVDWMFGMPGEVQIRRTPDMVKASRATPGRQGLRSRICRAAAGHQARRRRRRRACVGQTPTLLHQRRSGADRRGLAAAALFRAGHQARAGKSLGQESPTMTVRVDDGGHRPH